MVPLFTQAIGNAGKNAPIEELNSKKMKIKKWSPTASRENNYLAACRAVARRAKTEPPPLVRRSFSVGGRKAKTLSGEGDNEGLADLNSSLWRKKRERERRAAKGPPTPCKKVENNLRGNFSFFQRLNVFGPLQSHPPRLETHAHAWARAWAASRAAWAGPQRPRRARRSSPSAAA